MLSDQEVLEQAIRKAIVCGWLLDTGDVPMSNKEGFPHTPDDVFAYYGAYRMPQWNMIIFNQGFCKALWSEACDCGNSEPHNNPMGCSPAWQYHLQQLVISTDRLGYLRENA